MEKKYQPQKFEDKIYQGWEKIKAFTPKLEKSKKPFSIIMPPPNANAPLHIGHAMFVTLEDILIRYHRMKKEATLWLPGADHAGILTQVVFERKLAQQGKTRFDLGRKKFYRQCFTFTQENKKIMYSQIKKLGASCDWSREKFTLDTKISHQVLLTFVQLYKDNLAYRGERLINWCPRCMTALSDLEVEHKEIKSKLWYIKYPLKLLPGGSRKFLVVATTRPETMLGDTALAVHPQDQRYENFVGQKIILPLVKREIPVIADKNVDPEFGTGVVKVTPAHDPCDWQRGQKHKLAVISVIGFDNKMTNNAGKEFAGLTVLEARKRITERLNRLNLLIKQRAHLYSVAHCERCKTMIESLVSKQWFIKTNGKLKIENSKLQKVLGVKQASLKELGILAVKKGLIKILPKRFEKNYFQWMKNLHDWCVSRQIWWGHQLPIWYCGTQGLSELQKQMNPKLIKQAEKGCGHTIVSLTKPNSCPQCHKKTTLIQDPDTFDCWFSSGQWPYNTLGFPKGKDYLYFYPTSVLETGYEILYLWVTRMIMLGIYRTSNIPFKAVYLHGLVRDAFGEKMSKSKGNVVDPLKVVEKHGADALRMALIVGSGPGHDISLGEEKIKGYRNFTNKVWNIGRFVLLNLQSNSKLVPKYNNKLRGLTLADKKIIEKLNQLIKKVTQLLDSYNFSQAGELLYQFLWHELADKYIEYSKARIKEGNLTVLAVLRHLYLTSLKLLHPFMPFLTEAIWQEFPKLKEKQLITASWPKQ